MKSRLIYLGWCGVGMSVEALAILSSMVALYTSLGVLVLNWLEKYGFRGVGVVFMWPVALAVFVLDKYHWRD